MTKIAILLEADQGNTLGGSCIRDLYNLSNHLPDIFDKILVFSHQDLSDQHHHFNPKCTFQRNTILLKTISEIVSNSQLELLFMSISGHGYQQRDQEHDELDGMDEYIKINGQVLLDDQFRSLIIEKIPESCTFIGLCDTCHSGSMFDLDYEFNESKWTRASHRPPFSRNCLSLGACLDNQLDNCDIGETVGFGGSLTVHVIELNLLPLIFNGQESDLLTVYQKLNQKFKSLHQVPVIQKCFSRKK